MNRKNALNLLLWSVLFALAIEALIWLFPPRKADYSRMTEEGKTSFIMRDSCHSLSQATMSRGRIKYLQERGASASEFDQYFDALDAFYKEWCQSVLPITKAAP